MRVIYTSKGMSKKFGVRVIYRKIGKCHRFYIGKVFLGHAAKAYRGSRGTAPPILNLGTKWKRVTNFTPRPLYPRTRTAVTTDEEGG